MPREILHTFVLIIVLCNAIFDVRVAPSGLTFAVRYTHERRIGNPTYAPFTDRHLPLHRRMEARLRLALRRWNDHLPVWKIAAWILALRYLLTAVPLAIAFIPRVRGRLRESQLGLAIAVGAILLAVKAGAWELLYLMFDVCTRL